MGASAWVCFGPYTGDLAESLALTCQQAFEEGDYYLPDVGALRPTSIDHLLALAGASGTHSVLDYRLTDLRPFSETGLKALFATAQPTRAIIEQRTDEIWNYVFDDSHEVEGNYIIVYKDGKPHELFVMGITGD